MTHPALQALQKIENDLKTGNVADNEEVGTKLKELQLHTCQLILVESGWKCGNDLLNAELALLGAYLDYNYSVIDLDVSKDNLLESSGIVLGNME